MSTFRSSAAKNPLLMPMKTGHRLAEAWPTVPTLTVSAARAVIGTAAPTPRAAAPSSQPPLLGRSLHDGGLRQVMSCNFRAGRFPHAVMTADVFERRIERA